MELNYDDSSKYDSSVDGKLMHEEQIMYEDQLHSLRLPLLQYGTEVFKDVHGNPKLFDIKLGDSENPHAKYQVLKLPDDSSESNEGEVYIPEFIDLDDFKTFFLDKYFSHDEYGMYNDRRLKQLFNKANDRTTDNLSDEEKIDGIFFQLIDNEKSRLRENELSSIAISRSFSPITSETDRNTFENYLDRNRNNRSDRTRYLSRNRNNTSMDRTFMSPVQYGYNDSDDSNESSPNGGGGKKKKWSAKYKRSINCKRPRGFSQKQYCKYGRNKNTRRKHLKKKKGTKKGRGTPSGKHKSKKTKRRHK